MAHSRLHLLCTGLVGVSVGWRIALSHRNIARLLYLVSLRKNMKTISTTLINQRLNGISVTGKFLKDIGFTPAFETKNGIMWYEEDVSYMLMAIGIYFFTKSQELRRDEQKQLEEDYLKTHAAFGYKKNGEPAKKRGRPSKFQQLMREIK
jgi:hypothetical protein